MNIKTVSIKRRRQDLIVFWKKRSRKENNPASCCGIGKLFF
jgi:hypothetical protein